MKIRTLKLFIKEGFVNVYRNKIMSLASISVITASLVLFGIFLLFTATLRYNAENLKSKLEMRVICDEKLDDFQISEIDKTLNQIQGIAEVRMITRKEAYSWAIEKLGNNKAILQGIDENFLPVTFYIKLKNPEDVELYSKEMKNIKGVKEVKDLKKTVDFVASLVNFIRGFSIVFLIVLSILSVFIISNTIKLTMFARKREINIMKYIGATDWFIKWPFVVEGLIMGAIGSIVSYLLVVNIYEFLVYKYATGLEGIFKFAEIASLTGSLMFFNLVIGLGVGVFGSIISIKRYLSV